MYKKVLSLPKKILALKKRYKIIFAIALLLISFFVVRGNSSTKPLEVASVEKKTIRQEISGSGTLMGKNTAPMHFQSGGKLGFINISVGDTVSLGEVIAGLDTQELNIALREAENTLRDKRAIVDKIKDDQKDITAESYAQRQTRTTAEVAQDNAYEGLLAAKKALQDAYIVTPITGVVTQAVSVIGQTVSPTDAIAQIVDISEIYFQADIDEADLSKVIVGLPAEVTLDAYPDKVLKGKVVQVLPQTKTSASGATVVTVKIVLENPTFTFVYGLSGQASIIIKEAKNALVIPLEALREDNSVVVQANRRLLPKKVSVGIATDTEVQIKSGLKEGEKVLLNPPLINTPFNQGRSPLNGIFRLLTGGQTGRGR